MGRIRGYYPIYFGLICVVVCYYLGFNPKIKGFDNVLNGTISFSSIVVGFIGALLAIILSISKSDVMIHLYSYIDPNNNKDGKAILFGYFKSAIVSGFVIVLLSMYMYIVIDMEKLSILNKVISYVWVFNFVFFLLSTYRIISILMNTLFKHERHESEQSEQQTQPISDYDALRERNTRNTEVP